MTIMSLLWLLIALTLTLSQRAREGGVVMSNIDHIGCMPYLFWLLKLNGFGTSGDTELGGEFVSSDQVSSSTSMPLSVARPLCAGRIRPVKEFR